MLKIKNNKKGISLVEIILVVVLITISLGFSVLYYQTSQLRADIKTQTVEFVSYLRLAHSDAVAGLHGQSHGMHVENDSYTTFRGGSYNPDDPNNYKIELPSTITIQNIALNGGGDDIIFTGPNGETNDYGTLDFVSTQMDKTITITVSKVGTVNY